MSALDEPARWVWLARVRRPQGRKGEVFAEILTDFPEKFTERKQLWLLSDSREPSRAELTAHWLHKAGGQSGVVLHFAGVESISAAETLTGLIVAVPFEERAALAEDEVHIADLIGCVLVDVAGAEPVVIGGIENVDRSAGPVPLLIVSGKKGEILVPFAKSFLRKLDVASRRVEMALPEGLLDLNN
ncbi:MAG TPA: ribosome maturation factor RimM [Terracidiphilus sp.]|jgi:16S rRNA processing protein RimM